jgi:hypothetical protein
MNAWQSLTNCRHLYVGTSRGPRLSFPAEPEGQLRGLIRRYIEEATAQEWPMMARRTATLRAAPRSLTEALQLTLALTPNSEGQKTAQREIVAALENAFDARRQRILISQSQVNLVKWSCLIAQAVCALLLIAMVHSDNRLAATITMGVFATGMAASVLLIVSHDRPFTGEISIGPDPLLQVMPEAEASQQGMIRHPVDNHDAFCPTGHFRSADDAISRAAIRARV